MRTITVVFILFTLTINNFAQTNPKLDSLKNKHKKAKADSTKVKLLFKLYDAYMNLNPDSALIFAEESLRLSEQLNYTKGKAVSLINIGQFYERQGNNLQALIYYTKAKKIYEQINNLGGTATAMLNMGNIYLNELNHTKALELYLQSLKIIEKLNDKFGSAACYNNIGLIYQDQKSRDKALEYYTKALNIYLEKNDKRSIALVYNNIGIVYDEMGKHQEALKFHQNALKINEEIKDRLGIAGNYNNIGEVYYGLGEYKKAIEYYTSSIQIEEELKDVPGVANCLNNLAKAYLKLKNYKVSIEKATVALQLSKEIKAYSYLQESGDILYSCYKQLGDYKNALTYYIESKNAFDSIFSTEKLRAITNMQTNYEIDKMQKEIELLEKEKEIQQSEHQLKLVAFSCVLLIILIVVFILSYYYRRKIKEIRERKAIQEKLQKYTEQLKELNATKDKFFNIIAHDLKNPFNYVATLSELLLNKYKDFDDKKRDEFIKMLHHTSVKGNELLKNLLLWARSQTGSIAFKPSQINLVLAIKSEIELVHNHAIQKNIDIMFNPNNDVIAVADENMVKTVVRNLTSNAIKFTGANGKITINIQDKPKDVEISIADTGVGIKQTDINKLFRTDVHFTTKGTNQETGTGLGLMLCKEFIEKHGGHIWVESQEGKGSEFKFTLPKPE